MSNDDSGKHLSGRDLFVIPEEDTEAFIRKFESSRLEEHKSFPAAFDKEDQR